MAILLNAAGKTVETNEATLRRLAKNKGDKLNFHPSKILGIAFQTVALNGKEIGWLFRSHEDAISYLANKFARRPVAATKRNPVSESSCVIALKAIQHSARVAKQTAKGAARYDLGNIETIAYNVLGKHS